MLKLSDKTAEVDITIPRREAFFGCLERLNKILKNVLTKT